MKINTCEIKFFDWLEKHRAKSDEPLCIETIRKNMKLLRQFVGDPAAISFQDSIITTRDGHSIKIRYYHATDEIKPLIIFLPGNGFVYDLFEENHSIISKIAKHAGYHAIMIDYRLAPEHPYPTPLFDALDAIHYIFNHITNFNADKNKVILAGYSSGANLAAVITNKSRGNTSMPIYHQFLISGAYDYTNSLHEYDEHGVQDRFLSPDEALFSFNAYCQDAVRDDPMCSPYWEQDLSALPSTTIMVGEYDGGRSQSEGYAKKLVEAGNDVRKIVMSGQTHGTIMYRKVLIEGEDAAVIAGREIKKLVLP